MTAFSALKQAVDFTKVAIGLRDDVKLNEAKAVLTERLVEISHAAFELHYANNTLLQEKRAAEDLVEELRAELRKIEEFQADMTRYEPHHTRLGGFCFRDKAQGGAADPAIYLCANCMNRHKKTYLQLQDGGQSLHCSEGHGSIPGVIPPSNPKPFIEVTAPTV
ncbi:hypothetical protein RR42_m1711 [Cupriavidus basilensis]|uniref:Uncharacterized protein n=2 Tax=Cupriavidus basilensis TaxID=68895 RepID=A0A0C4Y817_9BURK|nr:hypothetical protein RR42_m1711 [Cupriavidus basilensis]